MQPSPMFMTFSSLFDLNLPKEKGLAFLSPLEKMLTPYLRQYSFLESIPWPMQASA